MIKIVFACLAFFPLQAYAVSFAPAIVSAFEFGGDNLINMTYTDGSTSTIEAGRGLLLAGGVDIDLTATIPHRFGAQLTGGIKWTGTKQAANGTVEWYRYPLELISFYHNVESNYRVGFGLVYQLGNRLSGTKEASNASVKFDDSAGFVAEADDFVGPEKKAAIGFRYTSIRYQPQIPGAPRVNGDSWGFNLGYLWF